MNTVAFALETYCNRKKVLLFLLYFFRSKNGFEQGTTRLGELSTLVRAVLGGKRTPPSQYCDEYSYVNLVI